MTDASGQRYLQFDYDGSGRITSVTDHTGRGVTFGYDQAGDLTTMTDVLQQAWTLTYDAAHNLRLIQDPAEKTVMHTEYDGQGRAYQQFDSQETLILELDYQDGGRTEIVDALSNTRVHIHDARNTLVNDLDSPNSLAGKSYDLNFRPEQVSDPNGNTTQVTWSADGANLKALVDGEGNRTDLVYDGSNNLTELIDGRGFLTTYAYSGTLVLSSTDALSNTTIYTYTTIADAPQPPGLLKTTRDPLGRTTTYTYDTFGQRTAVIDLAGTTTYGYDALGRTISVTYPSGLRFWTCYDTAGRVVRSVSNASGDGGTPQTDPCDVQNYQPSPDPAYDRVTTTVYDLSGNVIANVDPDGLITRTYFDANNRPVTVVRNLAGQSIETSTPPTHDPDFPTQNVRSDSVYDANGNLIATIDVEGRITRNYFDELNRPAVVVQNLVGQSIATPTPPIYDPGYPDRNVRMETVYDAAGNAIASIDANGKVTRIYYDRNNQPWAQTQNLTGQAVDWNEPPGFDPDFPDQNVTTFTYYDENGNMIATEDSLGYITRTYYDALNRPVTVVQNLVGQNIRSDTVYDAAGNAIATVDPLGHITRTYYDALYRPAIVVYNLVGQSIETSTPPEYDPYHPDQNVRSETVYEQGGSGKVLAIIDPLGRITRTYYDALERPVIMVQNLVGQSIETSTQPVYDPDYPDQNVRKETVYGPDGEVLATVANDGTVSRTYYDELKRPVVVVQNLVGQSIETPTPPAYDPDFPDRNVRTQTIYNSAGRAFMTVNTLGQVAHTCYDGLGRATKSVRNPSVGDPCTPYTPSADPDRDVTFETDYDALGNTIAQRDPNGLETTFGYDGLYRLDRETDPLQHSTTYAYDAAGNRTAMTDARNVTTYFEYDGVGRLAAVTENYRPDLMTYDEETNVRTVYEYDGNGNRTAIVDGNEHSTVFEYDGLDRLVGERDAEYNTYTYGYDAAGNRTSVLDPNGATSLYLYDGLHRLAQIDYPSPQADVMFTYDAAGRRRMMSDDVGQTTWSYDGLGRTIAVTDPYSGTVGYGYDGLGRRTALTYPDTRVVSYNYDTMSRLSRVVNWDLDETNYTYDAAGQLLSVSLPNGVTSAYTYDEAGRLEFLAHETVSETLSSYQYSYDEAGNRTQVIEQVVEPVGPPPPPPATYFYDDMEAGPGNWLVSEGNWALVTDNNAPSPTQVWASGYEEEGMNILELATSVHIPSEARQPELAYYDDMAPGQDPVFYVEVSIDEGQNWTKLNSAQFYDLEDPQPEPWSLRRISLENYRGQNIYIRFFVLYANSQHEWKIDNVRIGERVWEDFGFPFYDDMEAGAAYWVQQGPRARLEQQTDAQSPTHYWTLTGESSGDAVLELGGSITIPGDALQPQLTFSDQILSYASFDQSYSVQISKDMGQNWTELAYYNWEDAHTNWTGQALSLDGYQGKEVQIRFVAQRLIYFGVWKIDDVEISDATSLVDLDTGASTRASGNGLILGLLDPFSFNTRSTGLIPIAYRPVQNQAGEFAPVEETTAQVMTITYSYDPLNRLTAAEYSDDQSYQFVYDPVGNRVEQTTPAGTDTYYYDAANRLTDMNEAHYTWDNNGNLLDDEVHFYTYDHANRLVEVNGQESLVSYRYNGLGDRLQQTVDEVTTDYTLDLTAGLTQVLDDGEFTYLYGNGRVAQYDATGVQYFLGDALGSVRQLVDANGDVTLAKDYEPYGEALTSAGSGATSYGYSGEMTDATGLIYLRARYLDTSQGRFLSKDTWHGDYNRPLSLNGWNYVEANPINATDPSGRCLDTDLDGRCDQEEDTDYRDLTDWLYREMVTNANGAEVQKWLLWNRIAKGWAATGAFACVASKVLGPGIKIAGGVVLVGSAAFHATALYEYSQAVKDGAIWDFKDEIGIRLGPGITLCTQTYCSNNIEYSVPGNIHFAYIGAAAGILGVEIQAGAGYAEISDPAHDPSSPQYVGPYVGPEDLSEIFGTSWWDPSTWDLGDEPVDNQAVTLGIKLWQKYKWSLTKAQFQNELDSYIERLSHHDPSPRQVGNDTKSAFPYPVGYFNNKGASYNILDEGR